MKYNLKDWWSDRQMNRTKIKNYNDYFFILTLLNFYFIIDYHKILFYAPTGIHYIRQTDSFAFAANYLRNDFNFFQPQVFNLSSMDGKGGAEFPIYYYISALLAFVTSDIEFNLRFLNLVTATLGFYYLFKLLKVCMQEVFYSFGFTFLFMSSTVLLYYSNNYLPDTSALAFTIIGWYYWLKYFYEKTGSYLLYYAFICFTISSLLKPVYLINPIAAVAGVLLSNLTDRKALIYKLKNKRIFISFILTLLVTISWYIYIDYYNNIHGNGYFLTEPRPIWNLEKHELIKTWEYVTGYWHEDYYYRSTFHVFYSLVILGFIFFRNADKFLMSISLILSVGSIFYFLLFYAQFLDHDYYFIAFVPGIIILISSSFIAVRNKIPYLINSIVLRIAFLLLCVLSLNYSYNNLKERYLTSYDKFSFIGVKLKDTENYLEEMGIKYDSRFIILTDPTPNGGLYTINRPGWSVGDTFGFRSKMNEYVIDGAKYIVFTNNDSIFNFPYPIEKIGEESGNLICRIIR